MARKKRVGFIALGIIFGLTMLAIYAEVQVRATSAEQSKLLTGDDLIPQPIGTVTHAIPIHRQEIPLTFLILL